VPWQVPPPVQRPEQARGAPTAVTTGTAAARATTPTHVSLKYENTKSQFVAYGSWDRSLAHYPIRSAADTFLFKVGPLKPNEAHAFTFAIHHETIIGTDTTYAELDALVIVDSPSPPLTSYVRSDLGFGIAENKDFYFFYTGANLHFTPVSSNAPRRIFKDCTSFLKRFYVLIGVAWGNFGGDSGRKDLFSGGNLVTGIGFRDLSFGQVRWLEPFRLSYGGIIHKEVDPDPLVKTENIKWTPFLSIALDFDFHAVFGKLGGLFK